MVCLPAPPSPANRVRAHILLCLRLHYADRHMHRGLPPPVFDMTTKWRRRNGVPPWCARPGLVPLLKLGPRANAIRVSQIRNHTQTSGSEADRQCSQTEEPIGYEEDEIENDFQKKCRKGAKFAAHTTFSAILGEISCLFSLALEFFTRFRGGSFQPLTHLSGKQSLDSVVGLRRSAKSAGLFVGR